MDSNILKTCIGLIVVMAVLGLGTAAMLPPGAELPVHWAADGAPDRYMAKWSAIFVMPLVATGIVLVFCLLPYIEPRRDHLKRSRVAYNTICLSGVGLLAWIHCLILAEGLGHTVDVRRAIAAGIGVLLILIGNVMGKIRSMFFLGIRTPWTLSNERSWAKTHRLGGFAFVALGMGMVGLVLAGASASTVFGGFATGIFGIVAILFVYSFLVWRTDPTIHGNGAP